jgi:hypothetical protein
LKICLEMDDVSLTIGSKWSRRSIEGAEARGAAVDALLEGPSISTPPGYKAMQIDPSLHTNADNYKILTNVVVPPLAAERHHGLR